MPPTSFSCRIYFKIFKKLHVECSSSGKSNGAALGPARHHFDGALDSDPTPALAMPMLSFSCCTYSENKKFYILMRSGFTREIKRILVALAPDLEPTLGGQNYSQYSMRVAIVRSY
jgi:hypothetical protein